MKKLKIDVDKITEYALTNIHGAFDYVEETGSDKYTQGFWQGYAEGIAFLLATAIYNAEGWMFYCEGKELDMPKWLSDMFYAHLRCYDNAERPKDGIGDYSGSNNPLYCPFKEPSDESHDNCIYDNGRGNNGKTKN